VTSVTLNFYLPFLNLLYSCTYNFVIPFLLCSSSSILEVHFLLIMSSFLSDFANGLGSSNSGGSIHQPLMDRKVISIDGFSLKDTRHGASDNEHSLGEVEGFTLYWWMHFSPAHEGVAFHCFPGRGTYPGHYGSPLFYFWGSKEKWWWGR